jgi:hypothetical protein
MLGRHDHPTKYTICIFLSCARPGLPDNARAGDTNHAPVRLFAVKAKKKPVFS